MYDQRVTKVRQSFKNNSIDAFFLSNFYNILYLTGFKTLTTDEREAFVLITKENVYLFTDARYIHKNKNITLKLIEPGKGLFYHLQSIVEKEKIQSLGIESEDLRVHEYKKLQTLFENITISPIERLIIQQRAIKDNEEVNKITKACEITDWCLKEVVPTITVGDTEKQIAFRIETWIREQGYDLAFDPIVAINDHSAIPHYHTKEGNGIVNKQSIILIDFGIKYKGYLSDVTRMAFINPTDEMMKVYALLLTAQNQTIDLISRENDPKIIDTFCRNLLAEKGLPNFAHSLGHGVGLEIHEYPKLSQLSSDVIQSGHIFTVEPGVYFNNKWGMRIEDTVAYEKNNAKILTLFSKEPLILK